ncbi:MAG: carboxypeptidase regulatory-like domain-containing protein [bacterium]
MKNLPFSRGWLVGAFFVAVIAIVVLLTHSAPATAGTAVVSGQVLYPDGSSAANVHVELHLSDGSISYSMETDTSGNFSFSQPLTVGDNWSLEVQPPTGYNKPTNCPMTFVYQSGDATRTVTFTLVSAQKVLTGTVSYDDGKPVTNADVDAYPAGNNGTGKVSAHTDGTGAYTLYVQGGTWFVNAVANLGDQNIDWIMEAAPIQVDFASTATAETSTNNFTVTRATGSLKVILLNSDGNKLTTSNFVADIDVRRTDGIGTVRKVASADSSLNIQLTPGIYRMCAYHNDLTGKSFDPEKTTFVMTDGGAVNLGTVQAEVDGAHLKGRVLDQNGKEITNLQLMAFSSTGCNRPTADTDSSGNFDLTVGAGSWTIGLNTNGGVNPRFRQVAPATATVTNNQTVTGLAITMKTIDRTVGGKILDSKGAAVTGFVGMAYLRTANNATRVSAPVIDGGFSIAYSSSELSNNSLILGVLADAGSGYTGSRETTVKVKGETTTKDITVKPYDATVTGTLTVGGAAVTNEDSAITVFALDTEGNFASTPVAANGTYSLDVSAGTWYVNYDIANPEETGDLLDRPIGEDVVTVKAGKSVTKNLTVLKGTNTITGTVTDADGAVVKQAQVTIDNRPKLENNSDLNANKVVTVSAETNESGVYSAVVPDGTYLVTAGDTPSVGSDELQPDGKSVTISGGKTITANLVFKKTNATISGTVKLKSKAEGGGSVTAWSQDGAQTSAAVSKDGKFTLHVTSGETWTLAATDFSKTTLLASGFTSVKPKTGGNTKNLTLTDTGKNVYGPVTSSFDATDPASVSLPDGTSVSVPSRALDVSGTVSLTLSPVVNLDPTTSDIAAGLSYEVKATDSDGYEVKQLNAPATISLPYDQNALGDKGLREKSLGTKYFDPDTKVWEDAPGIVDTKDNSATLTTTHLTRFSITGVAKTVPRITKVAKKSLTTSTLVITVTGKNFTGKPTATLDGVKAKTVRLKGSTLTITFATNKLKAGEPTLIITNGNGRTATLSKALRIIKKGASLSW